MGGTVCLTADGMTTSVLSLCVAWLGRFIVVRTWKPNKAQPRTLGCQLTTHWLCWCCRWFVSQNYTDCSMVQKMYERGDEIASHTITHPANPNATEIVGQRMWLNQVWACPGTYQCHSPEPCTN